MPNPETENLDVTSKLVLDEADEMLGRGVQIISRSLELADRATVIAAREAAAGGEKEAAIVAGVARFGGHIEILQQTATRSAHRARKQLELDLDLAAEEIE